MKINLFLFYLFVIEIKCSVYYGDYFDEICSLETNDHTTIKNLLKYFDYVECKDILDLEFTNYFPEILTCCDELNACYEVCDTTKLFCDDRFKSCLDIQCSENLPEEDKDKKAVLCLMMLDYHYSYKKLFGCEYYYYHKFQNSCF